MQPEQPRLAPLANRELFSIDSISTRSFWPIGGRFPSIRWSNSLRFPSRFFSVWKRPGQEGGRSCAHFATGANRRKSRPDWPKSSYLRCVDGKRVLIDHPAEPRVSVGTTELAGGGFRSTSLSPDRAALPAEKQLLSHLKSPRTMPEVPKNPTHPRACSQRARP